MFANFEQWLLGKGLSPNTIVGVLLFAKILVVAILSIIANYIAKKFILVAVQSVIRKTKNKWDDIFVQKKVFLKLSHLAPACVIFIGVRIAFPESDLLISWIQRLVVVYITIVGFMVISAVLDALLEVYKSLRISKRYPIEGYIQIVNAALYFLCGLFCIATILNKSPWGLLSVLGGLTAVLLLVFKDTILGFVASIQLISYNMVRKGDWISMPKYGADGDVIEVSVHTVKVQNWDKTITTIPTSALISDSFKNWRGMSESGGRRIKKSICIDMNSVKFCSEEMVKKFARFELLEDYVKDKKQEIQTFNEKHKIDTSLALNGRCMTNLGTFRIYVEKYLKKHPKIHKKMTFLVRYLAPTDKGLPLEIYVFSNDQVWANYEALQSDIVDHLLAAISEFELQVFQSPSGSDLLQLL